MILCGIHKHNREMAAAGIVGLALGSAANLRTTLVIVRQRYEHFSDNEKELDELLNSLVRITENLRECEHKLRNRPRDEGSGIVVRNLTTVNRNLLLCRKVLDKLAKGPLQVHSRRSCRHIVGKCWEIASANKIHGKLNAVSANLRHSDEIVGTVATLLELSERPPTQASEQKVDRYIGISSVPSLTDQELLNFDGEDEYSKPTPEAQLRMLVLDKHSKKVTAAAGTVPGRPHAKLRSAHGMAGVGKTVALRGLGRDKNVREAFDEIHYITLGHDATADTVVYELARIVEMSGGESESPLILKCKDVKEAVTRAGKWFSRRKCLFLVDDVWKTAHNTYGYLPILRELLSGCEGSKMVITTRDINIASEVGQSVQFGSRGPLTSRQMFLRYFVSDISDASSLQAKSEESVEKILTICSGLPLALGIAGRGARALKDEGRRAEHALGEYASRLEQRRSKLVEETLPGYGGDDESQNLRAAIETSLDFLDNRNKITGSSRGIRIGEMYRALGVLKTRAWAPLSMLAKLWNVDREEAESVMGQLCTMSLAKRDDYTFKAIRSGEERAEGGLKIHDLQLEYCQIYCKEIRRRHAKLLDGYLEAVIEESKAQGSADQDVLRDETEGGMFCVKPRPWWSESVEEDGYVHENVAWHLVKAGKQDELRGLLIDARWIKLRLVIGGIVSMENDFAELVRMEDSGVIGSEGSATNSSDSEFRAILNALRCSWQYVVQNEGELAIQLGARLFDAQENSAAARELVNSAISNSERPFAEALYGFLPNARSGQINEVHLGKSCRSLVYSSCGKYIAAAVGEDVTVVEADTLAEKLRFKGHTELVTSVCFLPQSLKIVSGSGDGTVRLWDLSKPDNCALTLKGCTGSVWSACASADGSRVAAGSEDKTVRLWNVHEEASEGEETKRRPQWMSWFFYRAHRRCQVLRGHTARVAFVCFSPDGSLLASASFDGTVRLWNGHTGKYTGVTIEGHAGIVLRMAFSPDGERIACGSSNGAIRLWRTDTGTSAGIVIVGHSRWVRSVAFSADGARIVSASDDMTVRVWSAETGAAIGAALKGHTDYVSSAVFSPDGERVASVSYDETLRIWEPERAGVVRTACERYSSFATCAAFSADGFRIAVGYYDGKICMRDIQSGRAIGEPLKGHTASVGCVAFSPDGTLLASGSGDRTVRLWNVRTGAAACGALKRHKDWVHQVSFSADGSKLLSHSFRDDCRCVWGVPSGALLWMSHSSSEDSGNVLSDAEALAVMEAIESQSRADSSRETAVVYYDTTDGAVKMRHGEGDVRLASLPPLAQSASGMLWMYIADRSEFAAVLADGRPVCLKMHI